MARSRLSYQQLVEISVTSLLVNYEHASGIKQPQAHELNGADIHAFLIQEIAQNQVVIRELVAQVNRLTEVLFGRPGEVVH